MQATGAKPSRDHTSVVRQRTYPSNLEISLLLDELRKSHATGQLVINLSQGGVSDVTFEESTKINVDNAVNGMRL